MFKNKSSQCLGWCPDSPEVRAAFLRRNNDAWRPKRVYEDRAWWCPQCWRDDSASAYDRFHSLYEPRLRRHVARKTRAFFPPYLRPDVTEEVAADTMRNIWRGWAGFVPPERVMYVYVIAYRKLFRRVPKENRPLILPFSESAKILPDQEQSAQDDPLMDLEEELLLDDLVAELPEPQRSYVRERLTGAVDEIADRAGRSKGTESEGLKHATGTMRKNTEEAIRYVSLMVSILNIVKWAVQAITALLAILGIFF